VGENMNIFLHNFLDQLVYRNGKKVLLYSNSGEKLKNLDKSLWDGCDGADFLCHSIYEANNNYNKYEKILLSSEFVNFNEADYLIMSDFVDRGEFLDSFDKGFYLYSNLNGASTDKATKNWEKYREFGYNIVVYARDIDFCWKIANGIQ
jgi:DNA polymerase IIIc chi subunit